MNRASEHRPRVGVPWRTVQEEVAGNLPKMETYYRAIEAAGGVPVPVSLVLPRAELDALTRTLDAVLLPGSSADVDPSRYGVKRHPQCADPDPKRERTDFALLNHAFAAKKPILAICYGVQLLNVYLGGTLLQDISSELPSSKIRHDKKNWPADLGDPQHAARIEAGSKLAAFAGMPELAETGFSTYVNSSHHQSILTAGRGLRITARAPDGVVEGVEWTADGNWVVGVQWHPERMSKDRLSEALFGSWVTAARASLVRC